MTDPGALPSRRPVGATAAGPAFAGGSAAAVFPPVLSPVPGDPRVTVGMALSALADGQADARQLETALTAWVADPAARRAWRDWHLIGDTLRSDELARLESAELGENDFLHRLRQRLAREPAHVGPQGAGPMAAGAAIVGMPATGWRMPAARAAGVAVVALGVSLLQALAQEGGPALAVAAAPAPTAATRALSPRAPVAFRASTSSRALAPVSASAPLAVESAPPPWHSAEGPLIRDPRLDSLLKSHRPPLGPQSASGPGGRIDTVGLDR